MKNAKCKVQNEREELSELAKKIQLSGDGLIESLEQKAQELYTMIGKSVKNARNRRR